MSLFNAHSALRVYVMNNLNAPGSLFVGRTESAAVGVVVPDSSSPGFVRIWDRDGSGPRFVAGQDRLCY